MSEVEPLERELDAQHGKLSRKLGTFANLAITYSGVGAAAGIFSLFAFSLGVSGPSMVWGWVLVGLGMGVMSLLFAELASHYPYAGVVYQWSAILSGRRIGWWVGWVYLFGVIFTLTSYYFTMQASVVPLFGLEGTQAQVVAISLVVLIIATGFNAAGIDVLGKFTKFGVIIELGVFAVITTLVLFLSPNHQPLSILTNTGGTSADFSGWVGTMLAGGIFLALWVQFSFENGGTLGEETVDAHHKAPRAVLGAWSVTFLLGLFFIVSILVSSGGTAELMGSASPVVDVISSALGSTGGKVYLWLILFITLLGANAFFAGAVRHLFSMARDDMLPFSRALSTTRAATGSPWIAVLVIAVITALPFLASQTFAVLVTGAVAVMYVGYFLISIVMLRARLGGWPKADAPFKLGSWGLILNVLALLFTGAMMINLLWPRDSTNPEKWGLPVAWWLLGVPVVVGGIYFVVVLLPRIRREEADDAAKAPASVAS